MCIRSSRPFLPPHSPYLMKALVKEAAGPGFVLKNVPVPTIRDDEVLIKVRRAGVCGTDVHIYEWDDWARGRVKPPIVVGQRTSVRFVAPSCA